MSATYATLHDGDVEEACPPPPGSTSPLEAYVEPLLPNDYQPSMLCYRYCPSMRTVYRAILILISYSLVYSLCYVLIVVPIGIETKRDDLFSLLLAPLAVFVALLFIAGEAVRRWPAGLLCSQRCAIRLARCCTRCEI